MKRKIFATVFFLIFSQLVFCQQKVRLGVPRGICAAPFIFMLDSTNYECKIFDSMSDLIQSMKNGTIDVANIPAVLVEQLVEASKNSLSPVAITSTIDMKLVSGDSSVSAFSDLLGKQIFVPKNTVEDRFIKYLLEKNEVPIKQGNTGVEIVNTNSFGEIVSSLIIGKISCAVLSEPYISSALTSSSEMYAPIDLQDEYIKIFGPGKKIPKTVMIVLRQFKTENKDAFARLESDVQSSIKFLGYQPLEAACLSKKYNLGISTYTAAHAIKNSNFNYKKITGDFKFEF